MVWAQTATWCIAATIFLGDSCDRTLGDATVIRQGRSRVSKAGHLEKFGFQQSLEASLLMIDRFASLLAAVRSTFIFSSRNAGMV